MCIYIYIDNPIHSGEWTMDGFLIQVWEKSVSPLLQGKPLIEQAIVRGFLKWK